MRERPLSRSSSSPSRTRPLSSHGRVPGGRKGETRWEESTTRGPGTCRKERGCAWNPGAKLPETNRRKRRHIRSPGDRGYKAPQNQFYFAVLPSAQFKIGTEVLLPGDFAVILWRHCERPKGSQQSRFISLLYGLLAGFTTAPCYCDAASRGGEILPSGDQHPSSSLLSGRRFAIAQKIIFIIPERLRNQKFFLADLTLCFLQENVLACDLTFSLPIFVLIPVLGR